MHLSQLIADGRKVHSFLNTEEIPDVVFGYSQHHIMVKLESLFGMFKVSTDDNCNLPDRLHCLSSDVEYALLIMSSICIAVFRDQQGKYGFFDPHSRRPDGSPAGPHETGTAVMFVSTQVSDLAAKIVSTFSVLGTSPQATYELMPVLFQSVDLSVDDGAHVHSDADVNVAQQGKWCLRNLAAAETIFPNIPKYPKKQRAKIKRRAIVLETKKATHGKNPVKNRYHAKNRRERDR